MLYTVVSLLDVFPAPEYEIKPQPPRSTDPFSYLETPELTEVQLVTPTQIIRSQPL